MSKRTREVAKLAELAEKNVERKLFNHYKDTLRKLKKEVKIYVDEFEKLSISQQMDITKKMRAADQIDKILRKMEKDNQTDMFSYLKGQATDGYMGMFYDLEKKVGMSLDFNMIDERYINTLVNKNIAGKNFSQRYGDGVDKLAARVKSELLDGAVEGKGYRRIAKGIAENTEASFKQAMVIARTEGHRVQSESTQQAYEEAEGLGIVLKKQWMSSLDDGTRETHADLDGQTVGIDEMFISPDGGEAEGPGLFGEPEEDINCRCTTITIVEGIAPTMRRDNITQEVIPFKDYKEWKKSK